MSDQYFPIIYVRGYAMRKGEQDDTAADPFCGFNSGSTVYRAPFDKTKPASKYIFESPILRLGMEYGYSDVYENGYDIVDGVDWKRTYRDGATGKIVSESNLPRNCLVIYRYYDEASRLLGTGKTPDMEQFATGLSALILRVRDLVCAYAENNLDSNTFRCYLVAHSMGGLVCRAFLQNPKLGSDEARRCIDKVFTYATPHNGIDLGGFNVPEWLTPLDISNFNRDRMRGYLSLEKFKYKERVDFLPDDCFGTDGKASTRFFCMVGSNRGDYDAAFGVSRTFSGHGSDGLVKIDNASVWGINSASGIVSAPSPTAYAFRSHSGYFGIVNSEEGYQNLKRFLFGDVRVDISLRVEDISLPENLRNELAGGNSVDGLYQFELLATPLGKRWYLTRRIAVEDSAACRRYWQLKEPQGTMDNLIYLSSIFLAKRSRVDPQRDSLTYWLKLGILVSDYQVNKALWFADHYEGSALFGGELVVDLKPATDADPQWTIKWRWPHYLFRESPAPQGEQSISPTSNFERDGEVIEIPLPCLPQPAPGLKGALRFVVSSWK